MCVVKTPKIKAPKAESEKKLPILRNPLLDGLGDVRSVQTGRSSLRIDLVPNGPGGSGGGGNGSGGGGSSGGGSSGGSSSGSSGGTTYSGGGGGSGRTGSNRFNVDHR